MVLSIFLNLHKLVIIDLSIFGNFSFIFKAVWAATDGACWSDINN